MSPQSPIHPMMMELCTVSTVDERLNEDDKKKLEEVAKLLAELF